MAAETPKLDDMNFENLGMNPGGCEFREKGVQKISVSDQINGVGVGYGSIKPDSFVVDMERFSHLTEKDVNANSRITLQRSLSRKGSSQRSGGDKKTNSITSANDRDATLVTTSPRAALHGTVSTPEKPVVVMVGPHHQDQPNSPQPQKLHNQITIMTGGSCVGGTTTTTTATAESKFVGKRFSFRRSSSSSSSWTIDPRRILFFFATLSSMGTILLIYFTLSIAKQNGDDSFN